MIRRSAEFALTRRIWEWLDRAGYATEMLVAIDGFQRSADPAYPTKMDTLEGRLTGDLRIDEGRDLPSTDVPSLRHRAGTL
jgi:hypothetical protein